jgi:deoxyadenosine/deoxycytidine kinase
MSYISIEGNIGAGKSTLVKILKEILSETSSGNYAFIQEPVDEWLNLTDSDGKNILDKFYSDQKSWSYKFQMNAFITRLKRLQKSINTYPLSICERTVETDRRCFAQQLFEDDNISLLEWKLYDEWFLWLTSDKRYKNPIGTIYLRVDPDVCLKRINKRDRTEESDIPLDYLKSIHHKHDQWLLNNQSKNVLVLDGNLDFEEDERRMRYIIRTIKEFLRKTLKKVVITC